MDSTNCEIKQEVNEVNDEILNENEDSNSKSDSSDLKLFCTPDIDVESSTSENLLSPCDPTAGTNIDMRSRLLGFGLAPTSKRRHNVLSLETKLELIKKLEEGESVASLSKTYNVGRATIFDIKNKKESILSFATKLNDNAELKTRKTVRNKLGMKSILHAPKNRDSNPITTDPKMALGILGTPAKRKHNVLSIETKIEIIQRLEKGESGASLAPLYNIGRATISDIKNKRDNILMFASKLKSEDGLKKRKTMRKANDTSLEDAVYMWYIQKLSQGEVVTGPLLCEKAKELNGKLGGPPDFKASTGWLKNFRSRHGIKHIHCDKDTLSVDVSEAKNFLQSYLDLLLQQEGYTRDDIYSADEAEIEWKTMPENSMVYQRLSVEQQEPAERVTVLACTNMSWNHSLPLLMIGSSKLKKCFGNVSCLPLIYKWQKNGWMDSEIFMEWYANDFIPSVKKIRELSGKYGRVLLLLDSATFHPAADMLNVVDENFKVMFFPPSVTALAHPMDQNAIKRLKWNLKKQILRRLLLTTDDEESMVKFARQLSLKECCYMLADAWNTLSEQNMKDSWQALWGPSEEVVGTPPPPASDPQLDDEKDLKEFAELFKVLPGFSKCSLENAREWLKIDNRDPGDQILNEDEIITSVMTDDIREISDVSDGEEDGDKQDVYPTHSEAFNAFDTAMEWCEQQKECSPEQLVLLKRLKDLAAKKIWISCDEEKSKRKT